jgi:CP family cyanate transporter-like MFS transporter
VTDGGRPSAARSADRRSLLSTLVALVGVALILRPQIIAIGPLQPAIQVDLGISHGVVGALSAIPILCMGIFAPFGPRLARRLGARRAIAACVGLIVAFGLLRVAAPTPLLLLALTFGIGLGMGLAGPILPLIVRRNLPAHPALGTGAYATGLVIGAMAAAGLAVELAGPNHDWRRALAILSAGGLVSLGIWLLLAPRDGPPEGAAAPPHIAWSHPAGWVLGLIFGLQSLLFYGIAAWLAAVYIDRGWSEAAAAQLLAVFVAVGLMVTIVLPLVADRIGTRRGQLIASASTTLVGLLGLILLPEPAVLWAVILGMGTGAIFPIVLTLPVDAGGAPGDVAATAARMLLIGYVLSAAGPFVLGLARDVTGAFGTSLWLLVGLAVILVGLSAVITPERLHRIGSTRHA